MSMQAGARLSPDGRYRWVLWRRWGTGPEVTFIGLNPSTADASHDDPTLRRCLGFARRMGAGGVTVVNLFGLRATDPRALREAEDPVGPHNLEAIEQAVGGAWRVVAAWGNGGALHGQDRVVRALLPAGTWCLGVTERGQPRHPLYLRRDTPLIPLPPSTAGPG